MTDADTDAMIVDAECNGNGAQSEYDYDVVVIGGGSGGLAFAKKASEYGASVALFDFVKPTPHGISWGLGGTCVNVGCIPKKLMHYTGLLHEQFHDAKELGWKFEEPTFNWEQMLETVNNHVLSLNFGYKSQLRTNKVKYIKAFASFADPHTIKYTLRKEELTASAKYIVLAMGGRPWVPNIPGREHVITSDDIFWRERSPGKTLCVGASYISLETAGFLHAMQFDVTVAVRSILLRGFDRDCADQIGNYMADIGVKFRHRQTPTSIEKLDDGKLRVTFKRKYTAEELEAKAAEAEEKAQSTDNSTENAAENATETEAEPEPEADNNGNNDAPNEEVKEQAPAKAEDASLMEIYDTVLYATGRAPETKELNLAVTGVEVDEQNGKIRCSREQTNIPHIFAIGDIVYGGLELTPVAIQSGRLLATRLFTKKSTWMNYTRVATTVFTPLEYSCCGYSEEEAGDVYGPENLEIYLMKQNPLETAATHRVGVNGEEITNTLYFKLICDKTQNEKVVGIHYVGPNAGEIMQGYALAVKLGCTKEDFDDCVGIHPTCAEWFTTMTITKASGKTIEATGC